MIDLENDKLILKDKLIKNIKTTMSNFENIKFCIQNNNQLNIQFESDQNCLDMKFQEMHTSDNITQTQLHTKSSTRVYRTMSTKEKYDNFSDKDNYQSLQEQQNLNSNNYHHLNINDVNNV